MNTCTWVGAIRLYNLQTGEVREVGRFNSAAVKLLMKLAAEDIRWFKRTFNEDLKSSDLKFEVQLNKRLENWLNAEKDRRYFKEEF